MDRTPVTTCGARSRSFSTPPSSRLSNDAPTNGGPAAAQEGRKPRLPDAEAGAGRVDVLILGAGAAGLACACEAGRRGLGVLLLERGGSPGRKLSACGGGRANFSNRSIMPDDYLCRSDAAFCRRALASLPPERVLRRVQGWRLPVEERDHGRLFLKVPAIRLVRALEGECAARGCRLACGVEVCAVHREDGGFAVHAGERVWHARAVVLALGSPACPAVGGSAAGWRIAAALGHTVTPARPALAPLLLSDETPLGAALLGLAGVSLPARLTLADAVDGKTRVWEDHLLFTHTGLSGPLVLGASLFWRDGRALELDLLPGRDTEALLDAGGARTPRALLRRFLPQRLLDAVLPPEPARRKSAELSRQTRRQLAAAIHALRVTPSGIEGLDKAEACSGGVDTGEIDPRSMESRLIPRLHIVGELLDVTGRLGGYNLHWAWASGIRAGRSVLAGAEDRLTGRKTASPRTAR